MAKILNELKEKEERTLMIMTDRLVQYLIESRSKLMSLESSLHYSGEEELEEEKLNSVNDSVNMTDLLESGLKLSGEVNERINKIARMVG